MSARRLAFPALLLLLATWGCRGSGEQDVSPPVPQSEAGVEATETDSDEPPAPNEPLRTTAVEIYFPSVEGDGLIGEFREIFATATPGDRAKQIIADLISGPTTDLALRAVPPGTRLRQVYVLTDGTAYVDFSSELTEGIGGGSMMEQLTVYAIIDSIAFNVREVQRVAILVNGQPIESMNGHMDLRHPLRPDPRWILGSNVVDARPAANGKASG